MEQKMNELLDVMDDKDLNVICVSETKQKGNDTPICLATGSLSGLGFQRVSEVVKV